MEQRFNYQIIKITTQKPENSPTFGMPNLS